LRAAPLRTILAAGLLAGALDITAACVVYGAMFGATPVGILQGIAAGLLGPSAGDGGLATAALGLACHFTIALGAAAVYFAVARRVPALLAHPWPSGALYGIAVFFFMSRVVVPLSLAAKPRFSLRGMSIGIAIHIVCVGLPIAFVVRRGIRSARNLAPILART